MAIMRACATKGLCETDQEPNQAWLGKWQEIQDKSNEKEQK